jgi:hypothetical protein
MRTRQLSQVWTGHLPRPSERLRGDSRYALAGWRSIRSTPPRQAGATGPDPPGPAVQSPLCVRLRGGGRVLSVLYLPAGGVGVGVVLLAELGGESCRRVWTPGETDIIDIKHPVVWGP